MTTTPVDVVTEVKLPSKAEKAQAIYVEEAAKGDEGLRARVIKRFEAELDMKKQGASTYFQNCKTKAAGGKVKHYRPASTKKTADETVDDSKEDAPLFDVELADGNIKSFLSQQEADDFKATLEAEKAA